MRKLKKKNKIYFYIILIIFFAAVIFLFESLFYPSNNDGLSIVKIMNNYNANFFQIKNIIHKNNLPPSTLTFWNIGILSTALFCVNILLLFCLFCVKYYKVNKENGSKKR